jgi:hypothetical protein
VEIYYNGRLLEKAVGAPNQVSLTMQGSLELAEPGWLVVYAEGRARENAQRQTGPAVLRALSAPFHIGRGPRLVSTRVHLHIEGAVSPQEVRVFRNGREAKTSIPSAGRLDMEAFWGDRIELEAAGCRQAVRPWLGGRIREMLRLGQSGEPSVWARSYWRRAEALLRSVQVTANLRQAVAPSADESSVPPRTKP